MLVVLVALAAVGLVGYGFFSDWRADQQRPGSTALRVGDTEYTVKYYTERLRTLVEEAGAATQQGQPAEALPRLTDQLIIEAIVLRFAGDLGQTATEEEVNSAIATILQLPTVDDPNFQTAFQTELANSGLTEEQYREMVRVTVLQLKVSDQFQAELPATAESVHYRHIIVDAQTVADDLRTQIEGGADFAQLAKEKSLDTQATTDGGDKGWAPKGVFPAECEETVFALEVGKLATCPLRSTLFVVYQVTETQSDRPIDEVNRPALTEKAVLDWLVEKQATLEIVNNMEPVTLDNDKVRYAIEHAYPVS